MFSRNTIINLVNSIDWETRAQVKKFALEFALEDILSGSYIRNEQAIIMEYLIQNPDGKAPNGTPLVQAIIEHLISRFPGYSDPAERFPELVNSLDHDGYILDNKGLRRKHPNQLPVASQENELFEILSKYEFNIAKGHYEQAIAAHARGDWAAANSQLRSFVEELFNKIADIIVPANYSTSHARRAALSKAGFFKTELNEWTDDSKGYIQGFWKRLHPEGSHPGLLEKDDCTFRLHIVIVTMHYFAKRFSVQIG